MDEELMKKKMQRPVGAALTELEWFLMLSFIDHIFKDDKLVEMAFISPEDLTAIRAICYRVRDQVFPPIKETTLEETLAIKPKKILTTPDLIV